jgi:hypothetical protein
LGEGGDVKTLYTLRPLRHRQNDSGNIIPQSRGRALWWRKRPGLGPLCNLLPRPDPVHPPRSGPMVIGDGAEGMIRQDVIADLRYSLRASAGPGQPHSGICVRHRDGDGERLRGWLRGAEAFRPWRAPALAGGGARPGGGDGSRRQRGIPDLMLSRGPSGTMGPESGGGEHDRGRDKNKKKKKSLNRCFTCLYGRIKTRLGRGKPLEAM